MLQSFGVELRKQCSRFRSISQVCAGTGINRQQFNKYLAGQILPSARTMRKICAFLGVSEAQLMSGDARRPASPDTLAAPSPHDRDGLEIDFAPSPPKASAMALRCGLYECFAPLPGTVGLLVRSLISVEQRDGSLVYSQRSLFLSCLGGTRQAVSARHEGVVLWGVREVYLVGGNTMPPYEPSILSIATETVGEEGYFTGLILTRDGHLGGRIALHYLCEKHAERHVVTRPGHYHLNDTGLDPVIARLLTARRSTAAA